MIEPIAYYDKVKRGYHEGVSKQPMIFDYGSLAKL